MAEITPDGRKELVALYLTMFGRAPTPAKLTELVTAREGGQTLSQVATVLADEADFAGIAVKDVDPFAIYVADTLLATDTPVEAREWSINWVVTQFQGVLTKAQIIAEAVRAIRTTDNPMYLTAQVKIDRQIEDALNLIDNGFSLFEALEIGFDNLPDNYSVNDGNLNIDSGTVAEINNKIFKAQEIINKADNSAKIAAKYAYEIQDQFENLNNNSLLVDGALSHNIIDDSISLGVDLTADEYYGYVLTQKLKIINNAANKNSVKINYTIADTLENISSADFKNFLNGATSYKITNPGGSLGIITQEQLEILKGADNHNEFTYIDLNDVETVKSILLGFGLTLADAKSIILQHSENIDEIASALKQVNLTVGEMAAILASSSGVDDPPVILSESKIKKYFDNYVTDFRTTEGGSDIQGNSDDNLLLGTNDAENFTGGDGEDAVIYDGEISRYELTKLYEGKSGAFSGYKIRDLIGLESTDKIDSDVEYIIFRDQKLKIPTTGIFIKGTVNGEKITGDSTNDVLFGAGGYDTLAGGDGVDTAVFNGNFRDHQLEKLYKGKNDAFSGYLLSSSIDGSAIAELSNDIEFLQFYDEKIELSTFLDGSSQPLSVDIDASDSHLKVGESTVLNFKFSEKVTGFTIDDIDINGGEITNLRGLGDTYYASFKNLGQTSQITVDIKDDSIKSYLGDVYISDDAIKLDFILDLFIIDQSIYPELNGGDGDDVFKVDLGGTIDGGAGFDQLTINGSLSDYTILVDADNVKITNKNISLGNENSFDLQSIERVHFTDKSLAFDMNANAGVVASVLFNVMGPNSLDLPLFVGVGLGQLENNNLSPKELALLAGEFQFGEYVYWATISQIAENLDDNPYSIWITTFGKGFDFMDELSKPPLLNKYANAQLIGIEYLEYIPQYL